MAAWISLLVREVPDQPGALVDCLRHGHEDVRELAQGLGGVLELEEDQVLGHALEVVEDVVEGGGEGADVLAVEGGDERGVEGLEDLAGDLVAVVLDGLELDRLDAPVVEARALRDLGEEPGALHEVLGVLARSSWKRSSLGMNQRMMLSAFMPRPSPSTATVTTIR